ncbi:MAG: hypothetical protein IIX07_01920 [Lachnospiraceae bacterium]|nr:hypothetical protein [Lachnospiraceae bacterium]
MKRLDLILEKLDSVEKKVDSLECKVDSLECRMDSMEHKMDSLEFRMDSMEHRMDSMEDKMNDEFFRLNLRLENEVFFGIKAVADGHADIMRKYKHLLDDRYDKEQILVRLVHHESKIHEIERNCKHCA